MSKVVPSARIQVLTDVDWDHMEARTFREQSDPTRPLIFIRYADAHDMVGSFEAAFGVSYFRYRAELRRIAEDNMRSVRGASLSVGFEGFEEWFLDDRDEFIFPIDDDDLYHPELARALEHVSDDTAIVLWDSVQAGFLENEPVPGSRRSVWPALCANNWGVRKSFLRDRLDVPTSKRFLSDQEYAQAFMVQHLGVSLEGRAEGPLRIFAPLLAPGVVQLADCYSVNFVHVGSASFFWVLAEQGDALAQYRRFDPGVAIPLDESVRWSAPWMERFAGIIANLREPSGD